MLKALYDYAQRKNLTLLVGYAEKTIKAFLCLTEDGDFVGVRIDGVNPFRCPDIGSLNQGNKCNMLVEKCSVIFPSEPTPKSRFFREGMKDLSKTEPLAKICWKALENPQCCADMAAALEQHKLKPSDRVSFIVENTYLVECPTVEQWWQIYRQQFRKSVKEDEFSLCLITGEPTAPMATVPKSTGLRVVGGHPNGDALICFDKSAFCSYGLKKSANAPVSEEAFAQVRVALDTLLQDAPVLAGMKFVHWYDKPLRQEQDIILPIFGGLTPEEEDDEDEEGEGNRTEGDTAIMQQARRDADRMVRSVESGQAVTDLPNSYYILLLSGVNGRVMVRQFAQGCYKELKASLDRWYVDLQLANPRGTGNLRPAKLTARLIRLLKRQSADKNVLKRLNEELSGLSAPILQAILHGSGLPDSVAVRVLQFIRSQMLTQEPDRHGSLLPDSIACQWLKVWLIRNHKEDDLMPEYNPKHPNPAYHIGAMVAVYAALQQRAYPDVNVTMVQRFFASAQQTPALVLGRLAKMSTHYLAKLENKAAAKAYEARLAEISTRIGDSIPTVLDLPEQSLFALGYYQMSAAMNEERRQRYENSSVSADQNKGE